MEPLRENFIFSNLMEKKKKVGHEAIVCKTGWKRIFPIRAVSIPAAATSCSGFKSLVLTFNKYNICWGTTCGALLHSSGELQYKQRYEHMVQAKEHQI